MSYGLKEMVTSQEFKAVMVLAVLLVFVSILILYYNDYRKMKLLDEYNNTCISLSNNLGDYLNESLNISCDCYYEAVDTGEELLDSYTKPWCSCDCLRDGDLTRIAIRAV